MTLGENIKNRREELKLSQEYVAEQLGVSRQAVSKWETGQSEPTASNLIQLAEVFDINLSELVDPHKNGEDELTAEKGRDPEQAKPYFTGKPHKICNYHASSSYVQLYVGNLPASES